MPLEMLCTKQIFAFGCTPEAIAEYHSLIRSLTYTTNDAVSFSEIVMERGDLANPINKDVLESLTVEDITCDDIRNRHKISDKCLACSNCKENKKHRKSKDQDVLVYLISAPANRNLKMFPKNDVEANRIFSKFESIEKLFADSTKGDDYGPFYGYIYAVVRKVVCTNTISGKMPIYEELTAEVFIKNLTELYPEYSINEDIKNRFITRYEWLCKEASAFSSAFSELSSSAKTTKIKNILGEYTLEEQKNKESFTKSKSERKQEKKEASCFSAYEEVEETGVNSPAPKNISDCLESFIEDEKPDTVVQSPQDTLKVMTLRPVINNGWLNLYGFTVPEEAAKDAGELAFYFLKSAVPTIEVAYNTDSGTYGFLAMFPDIAKRLYIAEHSRLVDTLLPFLAHRTLYHFFTSNLVGVSSLCINRGNKPENVTQVDVTKFTKDAKKPDTFIAYVDYWGEYKNDFTSRTDLYFKRALGRSLYISDISPYDLPYVNADETFNVRKLEDIKTEGYLLVKLMCKNILVEGDWIQKTKSMVAAFEEKGVLAKHGVRVAEIKQAKEELYFIVPEGEYRAFHTLLIRTAMSRYRQQDKSNVRVEATPLVVK